MKPDDPVCLCFHVTRRKIENFIRVEKPLRASQLSECFGAGTGCGWCRPVLNRILEIERGIIPADQKNGVIELTESLDAEDYARQRAQYVRKGGGTPPAGATPID